MTFETLKPKMGEIFDVETLFRRVYQTENPFAWLADAGGSGINHFAIGYKTVDYLPTNTTEAVELSLPEARHYGFISYEGNHKWFQALSWVEFDSQGRVTALEGSWDFVDELPEDNPASFVEFRSASDSELGGVWRYDREKYLELIHACKEIFTTGEITQLCLTNMWESTAPIDEVETWLRLLENSTSPYSGFLRVGEEVLISASPECFISISEGKITTSPIKGTRPRGETLEADEALKAELAASIKEQEENQTIADAVVEELSSICKPGTAKISESLVVKSFAQVHQLVSTITGELIPGVQINQVLDACFPAGSMTGHPKDKAIAVLRNLEQGPRGAYSGCFGFISPGRVELGMIIRSLISTPQSIAIGAGGGLTAKSEPAAEVEEAWYKARAVLEAIAWIPEI